MEKELVELFEAAKKAADAAASMDGGAEESRCIDALEQLKSFPVTYQVLVSTQVGKRLRHLTKHPRKKIQAFATNLIEMWKEIVIKETNNNKKNGSLERNDSVKVESPRSETSKTAKLQKSSSVKVETVKAKREDDPNGTPSSIEVYRTEITVSERKGQTDSIEKVKVEKITSQTRQISGPKKPSVNPSAPPKLTAVVKTNDAMRNKTREILCEVFSKVPNEVDEDLLDEVSACDPIRVAVSVESVLFENWGGSNGVQKVKYRSLLFNLRDQKNPDFRRKVFLGHIKPERLIDMNTSEMASDQRQRQNQEIVQKAMFECERGGQPKATTDQFKCGRCGQRKTTYYQMQTRSADEPMTTYVTCVNCNNRWKFC